MLGSILDSGLLLVPALRRDTQTRLGVMRMEAAALRRGATPWEGILDRVPAWLQALRQGGAGLLTDGVWGRAAQILGSAQRSAYLIAMGVPTNWKGGSLFQVSWLLGE